MYELECVKLIGCALPNICQSIMYTVRLHFPCTQDHFFKIKSSVLKLCLVRTKYFPTLSCWIDKLSIYMYIKKFGYVWSIQNRSFLLFQDIFLRVPFVTRCDFLALTESKHLPRNGVTRKCEVAFASERVTGATFVLTSPTTIALHHVHVTRWRHTRAMTSWTFRWAVTFGE